MVINQKKMKKILLIVALAIYCNGAFSQAQLVKDINTTTSVQSSSPSKFVTINGITFFTAMNIDYGYELWKTDGTTAGTEMVMDVSPGTGGSNINNLINMNGTLYFSATANAKGMELWRSDGTDTGTVMVKDIYPGAVSSITSPSSFAVIGSTLYFPANDGINGYELWKSDGTDAGTVMVKDIYPGITNSSPSSLTVMGSNIYFSASDGTNGIELWKSDGTTGGTGLVKDIWPGINSSSPLKLMAIGNTLFFRAADSTASGYRGVELWKSNGTTIGTSQVKDIFTGIDSSNPDYLTAVGTTLYFSAYNATYGQELWRSDSPYGSANTMLVADINPNVGNSSPQYITNVNGILFFSAYDITNGTELWLSGGDSATTGMVKDINTGIAGSNPTLLTSHNNTLYFVANEPAGGFELWRSDGTANGTYQVKDIETGTGSSNPLYIYSGGTYLFFGATTTTSGMEPWKSDGTAGGTSLLLNINPEVGSSSPSYLININDTIYFGANDGVNGNELWKSDGTSAGTIMIKDIYPGTGSSLFGSSDGLININGTLFFAAQDGINGIELWKSDKTAAGTVMIKDIFSGSSGSYPAHFMNVNGTLFFFANNGTTGNELWKSDGTPGGTVLLKDINPGSLGSNPLSYSGTMVSYNNKLYFQANDGINGNELWVSDGTTGGTELVKDIFAGGNYGSPYSLTVSNGKLFFYATDAVNGTEIWMSDGTAGGTTLLKDIMVGSTGSSPLSFFDMNGILFFGANDGGGSELWKSDGTPGGTVMVKNIWPGNSPNFSGFTKINNTLFFRSKDAAAGSELWKTDGTAAGTVLVRDYWAGTGASLPSNLINFHDTLFYSGRNSAHGTELMVSSGTPQTTGLAADVYPGVGSSTPLFLVATTNNLFFMANDGTNGKELWKLTMPPALQSTSVVTNLICNGGVTGAIDITVSGGTAPYAYLWSDSSVTEDVSGLAAGSYSVMITDSWGWKIFKNFNVSQPAPITVSLSSQTNVSCNGGNNGSINISVVGPDSPFTFLWSPGGATTQNISSLTADVYSVAVSNTLTCTKNFSVTITEPLQAAALPICMVTVDTLSTHTIIYWEKPVVTNVDSFKIYREVTTNLFAPISSVAYNALSEYHDYAADPNVTSYKYKITARDSCGNESTLSDYHNTIHLQNLGGGNLQWTLYGIENATNPVNYYRIYRDDYNTGNYLPISLTIPGGNSTYTDVNYSLYPAANYRVDVAWSITCSPTRASVNTTRSNIKHQSIVSSITEELSSNIIIYPNPVPMDSYGANESLTIELSPLTGTTTIRIIDVLGQLMEDEIVLPSSTSKIVKQINVSGYAKGIYTVCIENNGVKVVKKLVVN